jgi:AP-4 complex subunit epsilon-1
MTNGVNVEFIVDKLLSFLASSVDDHFRSDLVNQITQCAERFAPSNTWYVQTIIKVFQLAGDKVKHNVAHTLTQLIAEGAEFEDDNEEVVDAKDDELRSEAVEHFLDLLDKPTLPAILAQTMAWVLGEYGYLSVSHSKEEIMGKLCKLAQDSTDSETKAVVMSALSKLVAQSGTCPSKVLNIIQFYAQSRSLDLQQRCLEILALLKHSDTMADVLPVDASCEDIEVDEQLSFLNHFVHQALQRGARPYSLPKDWQEEEDDQLGKKKQLKVTPYAMPNIPAAPTAAIVQATPTLGGQAQSTGPTPLGPALTNAQPPQLNIATAQGNQLINTRSAAAVWGKKPEPPPPAPSPVAQPQVQQPMDSPSHHASPAPSSNPYNQTVHLIPSGNNMWNPDRAQQQGPGSSNTLSPAAPPAPEQPRVLTEKEKMAAALFGGMGAKPTASSAASKRKSVATASPAAAAPVSQQPTPDLFSGMSSGVTTMNTASPTVPSSSGAPNRAPMPAVELLDIMSDDFSTPAPHMMPAAAPLAPAPAQNYGGNGLLDLGMPAPAPMPQMHHNPPPPVPAIQPTANLISDVFGNMDLSGAPTLTPGPIDNGMRPLVINTQEYGRRWGSTPIDAKQSVSCGHLSRFDLETLRRALPTYFHHVESIPNTLESIYAGTVTTIGAVVLVHVKLQPTRRSCDVLVKSTSQEISSRELNSIAMAISNFRG